MQKYTLVHIFEQHTGLCLLLLWLCVISVLSATSDLGFELQP